MAMENLKTKNKKMKRIATIEYDFELLSIKRDIAVYQLTAELYSKFWKPEKLIKSKENEEFKDDEDFKEMVQYIEAKMKVNISNSEWEIRQAKETLKKYRCKKESEGKDNE